jgi:signal transduction histidine kinase/DNA-binding response OmpR family regulator
MTVREVCVDTSRQMEPTAEERAAVLTAELRETRQELAATSEILAILALSSGAPDDVFGAIVEHARVLCRATAAQIHLHREGSYQLVRSVGVSHGFVVLSEADPVRRDRTSLIGRVVLDRTTQQIVDVLADPEYDRPAFQRLAGYRTIMGAPMLVDDDVVGVLSVWRTTVDPFDERIASLLTTFAAQGALAVRNVELMRSLEARSAELTRRVDQLEALAEVGEALNTSLDADEVLRMIVDFAVQLSGADGGSLLDFDEETGLFSIRMATGTSPEVLAALRSSRIHIDETLVGRACKERRPLHVRDLDAAPLDAHLAILRQDGWRSVAAVPMIRSGAIVGALVVRRRRRGIFSDVTSTVLEAFANQSAIALTNARLYQQLEWQSQELAEASRHKSEFLASMSHELRTPLNAVIGFSEVLLERMFGDINERQEDYLRDILSSGRHLLALLNDILDLSKVEAGQMQLDRTDFSVEQAISYSLAMVRERALSHRIALRTDVAPDVGLIDADELRFKQVLLNLLSNAVKFTPDGGSVAVTARRAGGHLEVTVSDTGVGIAPADQQRVFDSFQQGARAAPGVEGTGLGLTLMKRIVELHDGTVWLRSELGHGSTFGFTLPLGTVEVPTLAHPAPAPADVQGDGVGDRPNVVVIEDDPSSAELISLHLRAAGLRPLSLASGSEGLQAVQDTKPLAVVLDIRLPGMDGWEVLTAIKADPSLAPTPVVVVSVLPDRSRGIALGASDYLVKPVSRDDLLAALRRHVALPAGRSDGGPAGPRVAVMVDDDPVALELAALALEPFGWSLLTCERAEDVFGLVRDNEPAVVLVDLLMPEMDGFEVIDRLRADPRTAAVPIVVLTSKTLSADDRGLLQGRIAFVTSKNAVDLKLLAGRLAEVAAQGQTKSADG